MLCHRRGRFPRPPDLPFQSRIASDTTLRYWSAERSASPPSLLVRICKQQRYFSQNLSQLIKCLSAYFFVLDIRKIIRSPFNPDPDVFSLQTGSFFNVLSCCHDRNADFRSSLSDHEISDLYCFVHIAVPPIHSCFFLSLYYTSAAKSST